MRERRTYWRRRYRIDEHRVYVSGFSGGARVASSFVGTGRGALPAGPDSAGYARYALGPVPVVMAEAPVRALHRPASVLQGCRSS